MTSHGSSVSLVRIDTRTYIRLQLWWVLLTEVATTPQLFIGLDIRTAGLKPEPAESGLHSNDYTHIPAHIGENI